ncbi:DUF6221 family protein [Streptomyces sp. SID8352]|uniref:DUF6221 family protein n=1 Tax=Streptomyces sp. SID8352 TaxID=2690338 RepID=UPI001368971C|nr:DUF6221 family protein [Streptomyces sp. SID8352]MYU24607.1 hypothetical protein [Streptomyces sp. SID8352]
MDELVVWLHAQLDQEEQQAFTAGNTLGGQLMLRWRAAGSGVEVDGMRRPVNEPLVVTNRLMEDMPGYEVERARALHIASHDPDRVMGEVAAKRRLLDLHAITGDELIGERFTLDGREIPTEYDVVCAVCGRTEGVTAPACATLRLLALPYADRPEYQEAWRP